MIHMRKDNLIIKNLALPTMSDGIVTPNRSVSASSPWATHEFQSR